MLAQKKALRDIAYILEGKDFLIETKYDGERIQCHINEHEIRFFTRNSHNYTNIYHKMCSIVRLGLS
jgi:DNA ligase-4